MSFFIKFALILDSIEGVGNTCLHVRNKLVISILKLSTPVYISENRGSDLMNSRLKTCPGGKSLLIVPQSIRGSNVK